MVKRRTFLKSAGATGIVGISSLAGCTSGDGDGDGDSGGGGGDGDSGGDTTTGTTATTEQMSNQLTFGNDGIINMGLSPSVPQSNLYVQYGPVRDYLETYFQENYGDRIPENLVARMNISNNYAAVIQALGQGTADLAETGPFAAALGVEADNVDIVLQRRGFGSWTYVSQISVAPDSDIGSLSDLSGEKVAFSDRLSTSGCLYPLYSMKTEGGIEIGNLPSGSGNEAGIEPVFAGGHTKSYSLLKQGQVAAAGHGGFVPGIVDDFSSNATALHEDEGLPRAPIAVSTQLGDEEKNALQQAFLEGPDRIYYGADGEEGGDDDLWFNAVREATVDDYQSVIDVANELDVSQDIFQG